MNVMKHKVYMNYIHPSCMLQHLADLWRNGTLCDAILTVDNMVVGKAHKPVLFAASPKIQTMYTNPSQNFNSDISLPKGVSTQSVTACLQYLYEGYLAITEHNVYDLNQIAQYLEIESIVKCCEDFIHKVIPDRTSETTVKLHIAESVQHCYRTTDTVQVFDKKLVNTKRYQRPDETDSYSGPDMPKRTKCSEIITHQSIPISRETISFSDRHLSQQPSTSGVPTPVRVVENTFKAKAHQRSNIEHCINEDSYSSVKSDLSQEAHSFVQQEGLSGQFQSTHLDSEMSTDNSGGIGCLPGTSSSHQEMLSATYGDLFNGFSQIGLYPASGVRRKPTQKIEDKLLIEKIMRGEDVQRNERQLTNLRMLNDELMKLDGSEVVNEFTVGCGKCRRLFKVPTDRDIAAKVTYFRRKKAVKLQQTIKEEQISADSDEEYNDSHELTFDVSGDCKMEDSGIIVPQYHPSSSRLTVSSPDKAYTITAASDVAANSSSDSTHNVATMPALLSRAYASQFTSSELLSNKRAHGKYNNAQLMFRLLLKEGLVHSGMWINPPCPREVSNEQEKKFFDFVFYYAPQLQPFKPVLWKKVRKSLLNRRSRLQIANVPPSMAFSGSLF